MIVLKKWLHIWYLGHATSREGDNDDDNTYVLVHVQGDKPEQDVYVPRGSLLPQVTIGNPPPQGCFGLPGLLVQIYVVDAQWSNILIANDAFLVGEVVATVCGKDACIVDVVLPGMTSQIRRCQLGQGYVRSSVTLHSA
ncbi:hypothetical protein, variant [Aphanomyces astaci]|uniref:Uncharacterized protein n=1 Tax=Aphanomyces astaci TaxID=112090 RepID=W4H297_APHAT|nr:hypothetical protein, variant [Aphanomyces astaci]ETV85293.1 hypothetical protein, variant [Aphanomyces astaci]|eukprot:XP_009825311.1 hypothetical protein, variant [Aphanomyces astaci]